MIKNPLVNAFIAAAYIFAVGAFMYYGQRVFNPKDTFLAPVAMISLFTLSAAVMSYLFVLQPILLYLEGKKKEAVNFFLQTVGFFALITLFVFLALFFYGWLVR